MDSSCITIIGKRGCGKTTLAKFFIRQVKRSHVVLINDYIGEYDGNLIRNYNDIRRGVNVYRGDNIDWLADAAYQSGKVFNRPVLLVLDEVDIYGKYSEGIKRIYRYGRHRAVSVIAVSRRPYDLPVIVRALTHTWIIFNITEMRDLEYLRTIASPAQLDTVKRLKPMEYITISL